MLVRRTSRDGSSVSVLYRDQEGWVGGAGEISKLSGDELHADTVGHDGGPGDQVGVDQQYGGGDHLQRGCDSGGAIGRVEN